MKLLEEALNINEPSLLQKAGIIHYFEICYHLSFKLIILSVEEQGFVDIKSPRSAIMKAIDIGLIKNGQDWVEIFDDIKLIPQAYEEEIANQLILLIRNKYISLLKGIV